VSAKRLTLRPIAAADANRIVRKLHYSGKATQNSQLHIGVFYLNRLEGALQYGPSIDLRRMAKTVTGSGMHDFMELNRMALSERLPRNSESRALAVSFRIIRREAPQIKWLVTFADGTMCGDGTIYRAAGFHLVHVRRNTTQLRLPDGTVASDISLNVYRTPDGRMGSAAAKANGAAPLPGFQIKYVKFLDPAWEGRLAKPPLSYDTIGELGASMYRGRSATMSDASEA